MVTDMNSWSEEFAQELVDSGVAKFCASIGLDFEKVFLSPGRNSTSQVNPYKGFTWIVFPHSLIPTGVLHSFSADTSQRKVLPWEEWLLWEGNSEHNSLYQSRQDEGQQIFDGAISDTEHPPIVLGQEWYCTVEKSLAPILF